MNRIMRILSQVESKKDSLAPVQQLLTPGPPKMAMGVPIVLQWVHMIRKYTTVHNSYIKSWRAWKLSFTLCNRIWVTLYKKKKKKKLTKELIQGTIRPPGLDATVNTKLNILWWKRDKNASFFFLATNPFNDFPKRNK